ncbi:MAG: replication initiation protein [Pseudomonadota bacterium]
MKELRVYKSNQLIEAGYKLSLMEQRLILTAIAQVDSRENIYPKISVTATQFASTYGMDLKNAYVELREAADALYERDIRYLDDKGSDTRVRWLFKRDYNNGEGSITLHLTPDIIPYLSQLKRNFTGYNLNNIAKLSSSYSIRLYELSKQYQPLKEREMSLQFLYSRLELSGAYSRFSNLKARVLEPALEEINLHTDIFVDYEVIRKGKTPTSIILNITQNPQQQLPL